MSLPTFAFNTSKGTLPTGTTTKTIPLGFTATAGRKLVAIVGCAATQTAISSGWSKHKTSLSGTEVTFWVKTAVGGETEFQLTQNGARPLVYMTMELGPDATFSVGSATNTSGSPVSWGALGTPNSGNKIIFWITNKGTDGAGATLEPSWSNLSSPNGTELSGITQDGSNEGSFLNLGWYEGALTTLTDPSMSYTGTSLPVSNENLLVIAYTPTIPGGNTPPVANAGSDQTVSTGTLVTLSASGSTDPDGTIASYSWVQLSGPVVTLSGSGASRTFTPSTTGTRVFEVTVTDNGGATDTDTVSITVNSGNTPPVANAGPDQSVNVGSLVTLNGGSSSDPDGSITSYSWTQTSGSAVTLSGSGATRTFTPSTVGTRTFQLTVTDNNSATHSDSVTITAIDPGSNFGASVSTENALTGTPQNQWWEGLSSLGLPSFPRRTYYTPGSSAQFSVDCNSAFTTTIYRLGHYGGNGAREIVAGLAGTPASQPAPVAITGGNGAVTCAAWSQNASWAIPADALPGWYMALFRRTSDSEHGYALFSVSDANAKRPALIVTGDATWHAAYNGYGGNNVYGASEAIGSSGARAFCSTYDKPVITHNHVPQTHFFNNSYPYLAWSERMGYEAGVATIEQIKDDPTILDGRDMIIWTGHNEYIPQAVMDKTKYLLAAGQNMVNIAGNDFFWRVKFTNGAFTSGTNGRNMWCKKDTLSGPTSGPNSVPGHVGGTPFTTEADWTGTWQDTRWSLREPSEDFFGDQFIANGIRADQVQVPFALKSLPAWRNCSGVQALSSGQTYSFVAGTLGMEWDRPMLANPNVDQILFSTTEIDLVGNASDANGENYNATANDTVHGLSMVKNGNAFVANFNSDQWGWALSQRHLRGSAAPDNNAMQMMLNVLADLGLLPHNGSVTAASLTMPTPVEMTAYGFEEGPTEPGSGGAVYQQLIDLGYTPYITVLL